MNDKLSLELLPGALRDLAHILEEEQREVEIEAHIKIHPGPITKEMMLKDEDDLHNGIQPMDRTTPMTIDIKVDTRPVRAQKR
jgi:hypothetical protein